MLINTLMRTKLLTNFKYHIISNNNDRHIWLCDVTGTHLTKARAGVSFV